MERCVKQMCTFLSVLAVCWDQVHQTVVRQAALFVYEMFSYFTYSKYKHTVYQSSQSMSKTPVLRKTFGKKLSR